MNQLYQALGISKQAVHKQAHAQKRHQAHLAGLVARADELRKVHPGCGVEKMYHVLKPEFMGRDRFIDTFMALGYRLKRPRNYRRTTIAGSLYHPNLIAGMQIQAPGTVWQSDITYIPLHNRHYYAVFIIDVYTRKIVGYALSDHMRASANLRALKMALNTHKAPLIHHSDRGSQYISKEYTNLLKSHGTRISMGLIAQDNAYAERINRTIKEEYLDRWQLDSFEKLKQAVNKAVRHYNTQRPHLSLGRQCPGQFYLKCKDTPDEKQPCFTIFEFQIKT